MNSESEIKIEKNNIDWVTVKVKEFSEPLKQRYGEPKFSDSESGQYACFMRMMVKNNHSDKEILFLGNYEYSIELRWYLYGMLIEGFSFSTIEKICRQSDLDLDKVIRQKEVYLANKYREKYKFQEELQADRKDIDMVMKTIDILTLQLQISKQESQEMHKHIKENYDINCNAEIQRLQNSVEENEKTIKAKEKTIEELEKRMIELDTPQKEICVTEEMNKKESKGILARLFNKKEQSKTTSKEKEEIVKIVCNPDLTEDELLQIQYAFYDGLPLNDIKDLIKSKGADKMKSNRLFLYSVRGITSKVDVNKSEGKESENEEISNENSEVIGFEA
ncbi:MAG: hypothetical protein ACK5LL_13760 [Suipraeoptans sp.]